MTDALPTQRSETISKSDILGNGCARAWPVKVPCVGACVQGFLHQPQIAIDTVRHCAIEKACEG